MTRLTVALVVLLAGGATALAQRTPPRDAADRLVTVRGRVLADNGEGTPLRRARLTVVTGGGPAEPVFTDELGRFEVRVPESGDYALTVGKSAFAPASLPRARVSSASTEIRLAPAAVVTGRVIDSSGLPIMGRSVRLRRVDLVKDATQAAPLQTETNDLGEYRFGNLAAGKYAVQVTPSNTVVFSVAPGQTNFVERPRPVEAPTPRDVIVDLRRGEEASVTSEVESTTTTAFGFGPGPNNAPDTVRSFAQAATLTRSPAGAVTGVVLDEFGEPLEGVDVEVWQIERAAGRAVLGTAAPRRRTDDRGRYRIFGIPPGHYYVVVIAERTSSAVAEPAILFYPGRAGVADAVTVSVQPGQDASGVDMVFAGVPSARVHGVALDATGGQPIVGNVLLNVLISSQAVAIPSRSVEIGAGGQFELRNVAPGDYVLQAIGKGSAGNREFGMHAVTVAGSDVGPVAISTLPGSTVKGIVTLEGAPSSLVTPPPKVGLSVVPAAPEYVPAVTAYTGGFIDNDWTFEMIGLAGSARFLLESAPPNWWLKSVIVDGIDAADEAVMFGTRRQSREGVIVVIGTKGASIGGQVRLPSDGKEGRVNYSVAVFPVDSDRWYYRSRYMKLASTTADGRFTASGFPPGEYWVVAVDAALGDGPGGDWQNPELLNNLTSSARRVTLGEGQRATIELRPVSMPR